MKKRDILALIFFVVSGGGCASPIYLRTYDGGVFGYPGDFSRDKPTVLAFLDINDRRADQLLKPLRALSAREEVDVVGVMIYDSNAFLEQITTKKEIIYPVMLDPKQKMVDRFDVKRYPTYIFLSPKQKELDRVYDISEVGEWCRPVWIDKAMGRKHIVTPEEKVDSD